MRKSPWLRLRVKEMQQTGPSRPVPLRVWRNGAKVAQTGSSPPQTGGLIMRGNKERRLSSAEGARWQQERREEAGTHRGVRSYLYVGDQTSLHQRHVINTPHKNTSETHELFRLTAGTSRKSPSSVHVLQPHVDTTTTLNHITETFCPNKPFTPDLTAETFVQQIYTELHVAQSGAAVCTQPACVYSQHVSSCAGSQRPSGFLLEKHEDKRMHMKRVTNSVFKIRKSLKNTSSFSFFFLGLKLSFYKSGFIYHFYVFFYHPTCVPILLQKATWKMCSSSGFNLRILRKNKPEK